MKVLILPDRAAAIARVAEIIVAQISCAPDTVLGLATGGTMLPVYAHLREAHRDGLSLARITSFNLDEYVGLPPEHPASYHRYMRENLFDGTDADAARIYLPRGDAPDPQQEADRYEAKIEAVGGIDLQLLGIGRNGHIGFNEPTSSLGSRTRVKTLTEDTRMANLRFFDDEAQVPQFAITMGIQTILSARHCLLLATGREKAAAVRGMVEGPVSAFCPASALQMHPRATVVLDPDAAEALTLRDYYDHIHPGGRSRLYSELHGG